MDETENESNAMQNAKVGNLLEEIHTQVSINQKNQENDCQNKGNEEGFHIIAQKAIEKVEQKIQSKKNNKISEECKETNNNNVRTIQKLSKSGKIISRELSEGEASSDFETILSSEDNSGFDDFSDLSPEEFIVRIDNELAYKNKGDNVLRDKNNHPHSIKLPEHNSYENSDEKARRRRRKKRIMTTRYDNSERKTRNRSRSRSRERRRKEDRRLRRSKEKSDSYRIRQRRSRSSERYKTDEYSSKRRAKSRSPGYRDSKTVRNGGKFGKADSPKSNSRRNFYPGNGYKYSTDVSKRRRSVSPLENLSSLSDSSRKNNYFSSRRNRKRRRSRSRSRSRSRNRSRSSLDFSLSPEPVRWRLDKVTKPKSTTTESDRSKSDKRKEDPIFDRSKKKERTPFLVELGKKLKSGNGNVGGVNVGENIVELINTPVEVTTPTVVSEPLLPPPPSELPPLPPQPPMPPNSPMPPLPPMPDGSVENYPLLPALPPPESTSPTEVAPVENFIQMPTWSVDNLPLVPGPTGLPIYISVSGIPIPYDMEGRRIPIGPNGHYLPVDPSGKLFPHIISPANLAVPIHMTDDGVLRLPNEEPVPFGPPHQLPVNIDGSIILMGPDSRPLYPCPNIPKRSYVYPVREAEPSISTPETQTENVSHPPQAENKTSSKPETPKEGSGLLELVENATPNVDKEATMKKYEKNANKKREDEIKFREIKENLGVNASKSGIRTSTPVKVMPKKRAKDKMNISDAEAGQGSGSDMILDTSDTDSVIALTASPVDLIEDSLSSDEEGALQIVCDSPKGNVENQPEEVEDPIVKKIKKALSCLSRSDFMPPAPGRFILSKAFFEIPEIKHSNESPLLRDRIKLPYITPFMQNSLRTDNKTSNANSITFRFLSKTPSEKKSSCVNESRYRDARKTKMVFTFDFAMQCDLTSEIINSLKLEVTKLEYENVKLKNINANLLDIHKQDQMNQEKKTEELKKALNEVLEKNMEIMSLKRELGRK